jgi:hypothetical protein
MAAQKRSSHRNYIDLVDAEEIAQPVAELQPSAIRPIRYLLGLVAAMRSVRGEAR